MSTPNKHTISKYNYLIFDSIGRFNAFVDTEITKLNSENNACWLAIEKHTAAKLEQGSDWYGSPTPKSIQELNTHTIFLGAHLIDKLQPKINDSLQKYMAALQNSSLPKPTVAYNDRGLGIFSFDKAAMSLHKNYTINNQTPLNNAVSQMKIELNNHAVTSSAKKVYAYFKNKLASHATLELYIMAGANARVKGNDLLYVGLTCAALVEFMEVRGISVAVNVLIGTSFKNKVFMTVIAVKRFEERLDKNQLLLISSDPRYFRYRGFKALIACCNYFEETIPKGLGRINTEMGKSFVKQIAPKAFVFEQSYTMDTAIKEVSNIIDNYLK